MHCPTCSRLLDRVGHVALWCARCGTLLTLDNDLAHTPKLVDACRQFEKEEIAGCVRREVDKWHQLGIADCWTKGGSREDI